MNVQRADLAHLHDVIARIEHVGRMKNTSPRADDDPRMQFSAGPQWNSSWDNIAIEAQELLERLRHIFGHYAWVETQSAITAVTLGGNMQTVYAAGINAEDRLRHVRTLAVALACRACLARLLITTVRTINAILAAWAFPPSALAAFRAGRKLIDELRVAAGLFDSIAAAT